MAPSLLLLSNSYKPGIPVTAIILLYSIFKTFFKDVQDSRNFLHVTSIKSNSELRSKVHRHKELIGLSGTFRLQLKTLNQKLPNYSRTNPPLNLKKVVS